MVTKTILEGLYNIITQDGGDEDNHRVLPFPACYITYVSHL